ncbi:MAG: inorganic diphosphatase [Chitinophagaceae bacterium]|nr:inorganic diphosphatase [Chitinophagaceae bacterium]MBK7123510.1 inorganic diphosphatase [Chitinophagaceae bacterium]MBK7559858.1 inorganic diphosphatase [Chitinophagaceae bacterium]MBK8497038.1 inorganic diphosphatase [Chitinophagaceae bacterium]MBK9531031.1 inorganic diphosphatase [Chitinophagaceae bacterium]
MYTLHPWHGAHYGNKAPQTVNAVIEIPQGAKTKYEVDKTTGLLKLDRIIYSSFHYPVNYGFIPQTLGLDSDPLDILVMCSESIQPLCLVEATVIGNMQMIDNGEIDDKIIAVATKDPGINFYTDVDQLPKHFMAVLRNFFEQYKVLENKKVVIDEFQHKEAAFAIIENAMALYKTKFPK